ncbi:hypothetical protein ACIJDA_002893 [Enterococcus faecalis]|uniref:hypothetical protein n=1 Tax=unclassified Enterococcus TaxID=2608891 RepID=UPI0037C34CEE
MLTRLGTELEKDVYVTRYMTNFKRLVLMSDKNKELTAREEHLLVCEKELCSLFYEQFKKRHGRAPDEVILDEQVKKNFIERAPVFARAPMVMDEANFIKSHVDQIKRVREMRMEDYLPDSYYHIIQREEQLAGQYFREHDDYPFGYESLMISRSLDVVNQGLERLLEAFYENYQVYYRQYRLEC